MNKKFIALVITSIMLLIGCKNDSQPNTETPSKKNEITNVISYFEKTIAADGSYDSEEDTNNTKEVVELKTIKNNTIFWCYDTQNLLKIEILGDVSNAIVVYKNLNNSETTLLNDTNIDGSYSIVPSESNGLNGGKIIIKSGDKVLKEIVINYEGCL
jgi:PBP1b-binding outer membrane lipoprotein LpoB